jgi:antitoxin component YwqK of YwqJK toxin-antitoxin module
MKKLFPLLLITILFSQNKEVIVDRYRNGVKKSIIIYEGEGSKEKLIRKLGYYKNGKLQFSTDWKDGMRNGNVIVNYENGELGFKGKYLNDRLDGNMVYYYTDSKIHLECKIQFTKEKTIWLKEIEDEEERNEMMEMLDTDSSNVYLMSDIKIYDENGKRYETIYESEKFDEFDCEFIYESEIVDVLNTLTLFDYGFFREVLKK